MATSDLHNSFLRVVGGDRFCQIDGDGSVPDPVIRSEIDFLSFHGLVLPKATCNERTCVTPSMQSIYRRSFAAVDIQRYIKPLFTKSADHGGRHGLLACSVDWLVPSSLAPIIQNLDRGFVALLRRDLQRVDDAWRPHVKIVPANGVSDIRLRSFSHVSQLNRCQVKHAYSSPSSPSSYAHPVDSDRWTNSRMMFRRDSSIDGDLRPIKPRLS